MLDATPLLRAYARRRLARLAAQDPVATQRRQLLQLVRHAAATRFGIVHHFAGIRSVEEYQRIVALRCWQDFWDGWWRKPFPRLLDVTWPGLIHRFANTSGTTTAAAKRIPVSGAMMRSNRRAALDVLVHHLAHRPHSHVLAGRSLMLGGSTALERLDKGIVAGDLSALAAVDVPFWARGRTLPPPSIALIGDWEQKLAAIAPLSLREPVTSISGTASWLLLFFEQVGKLRPRARLCELYPMLELVVHGGVGFAPYRAGFKHWLEGSRAETREVYPASEGFIGIADRGDGDGLRMELDNGIFYEFVRPEDLEAGNPDRRWIADAELGVDYALILSTNAGLWSYVLGDTVRLIDRAPPRLLVSGRVGWMLSVTGEHVSGEELEVAMAHVSAALGRRLVDYAAAPVQPDAADCRGGHLFVVELDDACGVAPADFAARLDRHLLASNDDYAAHRGGQFGMRDPQVILARRGTFADWMRARGRLGGQNKVPRVIQDPAMIAELRRYAEAP
jgi:hypothetical protein